jgi:hypothetical protein
MAKATSGLLRADSHPHQLVADAVRRQRPRRRAAPQRAAHAALVEVHQRLAEQQLRRRQRRLRDVALQPLLLVRLTRT